MKTKTASRKRSHGPWCQRGSEVLTDEKLLEKLLFPGGGDEVAVETIRELLRECQGLGGFSALSPLSPAVRDLRPVQTDRLFAFLELARRVARAALPKRDPMSNPGEVARYLALRFATPGQEVMGALFLDSRNRLMDEREIYRGTLSRAAVEPRAVFKEALLRDAAGFVLFHTHPSGDPTPSAEDLAFTRRIAQSGELLGVRLVDHLILGRGDRWVSLRQSGGW